jgi:hypothetical protein
LGKDILFQDDIGRVLAISRILCANQHVAERAEDACLAPGVRQFPEIHLVDPPRMADFATFAVACGLDTFDGSDHTSQAAVGAALAPRTSIAPGSKSALRISQAFM